ncbi:RNA methyltransferase [Planococcus sp. APC 3906]|uniref:TRM11 family SAM-dependent methyltransferase n=1 Tax=Planococcus sp. APC 3906 TaxID=3035194 RepID=UPI0025B4998B|nr:RNA methyltransferase [Planococcus sp. APC 3906]MDN3451318.1 RNA methyltransferase [Planococcus sp. APC 3906]
MTLPTLDNEFIYTYAYTPDEEALCFLEMRALFGEDTSRKIVKSQRILDPSRSPFIKERIEVLYEDDQLDGLIEQLKAIHMGQQRFKVLFVKINGLSGTDKVEYQEKRSIEHRIGQAIEGTADMHEPDVIFGLMPLGGRWYFGYYTAAEAIWFKHLKKPRQYSTALSTKVARAVANIAVPKISGVRAIDPCCGIGTVLVEGLSMGMDIVGRDLNPLVVDGSIENIAHFGLSGEVGHGPISDVSSHYDVAIIDMPYNLFTSTSSADQLSILTHAADFADKMVLVTMDNLDPMIDAAGFDIIDRCIAKKAGFSREIVVCLKRPAQ